MKNDTKYTPWLSLTAAVPLVRKQLGTEPDDAGEFMVSAAASITEASSKIQEAVTLALGNKLASSIANAQAARKAIAKIAAPTLKRISAAAEFASTAIDLLVAKTDPKAPTDLMDAMQHQEVRSVLLKMSDVERRKAIANAISSGDETFLSAAVSGSPTLSGMS